MAKPQVEKKQIWKCPECSSPSVTTIGDNMVCLSCGYQEYLFDYNSAWDSGFRGQETERELETKVEMPIKLSEVIKEMQVNITGLMRRSHIHEKKSKGLY